MKHMHTEKTLAYYKRNVWHHDHPGSFTMEDGKITHDHKEDTPTYPGLAARFLYPKDEGGAD